MIDFQSSLLDPIYLQQGVPAELTLNDGRIVNATALDKTRGVVNPRGKVKRNAGRTLLPSVDPLANIRMQELIANSVALGDLPGISISLNGNAWSVKSYKLRPTTNGPDDGEVILYLETPDEYRITQDEDLRMTMDGTLRIVSGL